MSTMPLADRYTVTVVNGGKPDAARPGGQMPVGRSADWWCRRVLYAALASLVISAVASGWTEQQHDRHPGALPGLTGFLVVLLIAQAVLLVALGVVVSGLARRARAAGFDRAIRPYLGGNLATLDRGAGLHPRRAAHRRDQLRRDPPARHGRTQRRSTS